MKDLLKGVVYTGIFAMPFVVLLVTTSMLFPYITGKNFAFRILVEISTVAWVLLALYDSQYRPRFSWIATAGLGLLVVMFFANMFGEYAPKAFWSNFERMEGYVTLVHFYLYFLVTGSMLLTEKMWNRFFNTTLAVATIVCFYAFIQIAGGASISQNSWRVDSTLGNSTYMAVYMLFHIFIASIMFVRSKSQNMRYVYGGLIALFVFMLLQTGTRGAVLGLLGGGFTATAYVALFAKGHKTLRKVALGGLLALVLLVSGFIAIRDSAFVQSIPALDRLTDITVAEGGIRFMIWDMAFEGIKERPILGWGQGNFNYIFNKEYNPQLYDAEAWYDRVHNIVLDWLVAGGIVGAFFYFSIFGACVFYLFVKPLRKQNETNISTQSFGVLERALLLGVLTAYVLHNLFVFDNIISYIFFAIVLAFIHSKIAREIAFVQQIHIDQRILEKVALPIATMCLIGIVYIVNIPAIQAASTVIDAFQTSDYKERFEYFRKAIELDTFGTQEAIEQLSEHAMRLAEEREISQKDKAPYLAYAEEALLSLMNEKPNDARFHVFLAGLYRSEGKFEDATEQINRAHELSPGKTSLIIEQGIIALLRNDIDAMVEYFTRAYELTPKYDRAQVVYAGTLFYKDESEQLIEVLDEDTILPFAQNATVVFAIRKNDALSEADVFFKEYIRLHPESTKARTAYAFIAYEFNNDAIAKAILEQAERDIPSFSLTAQCYIKNIDEVKPLQEGC